MKVLGFIGSPRKDGNTAFMVNKILEGAKEEGASVQAFHLNEYNIKPCQSCYGCKQGEMRCSIKDDMGTFYDEIEQADAFVLGSPVYMWQMSAQSKMFTDRLFAIFNPVTKEKNNQKKVILAFTHGNPDSGLFESYFDYTKKMFEFLGFDVSDVYIGGDTQTSPLSEKSEQHQVIKNIGTALMSKKKL